MRRIRLAFILIALAATVAAQEPRPAFVKPSDFNPSVELNWLWRIHPGDDPRWADPSFDDRGWATADPQFRHQTPPPVAWLRRHIVLDRSLESVPFTFICSTHGHAKIFLDGVLVATATPDHFRAVVTFKPQPQHVLAVQFTPGDLTDARRLDRNAGFLLTFSPLSLAYRFVHRAAILGTFFMTVPLLLAFLHLAFFSFLPRRRENLYYSLSMIAFSFIVLCDFGKYFFTTLDQMGMLERLMHPAILSAIFFTLLTFYAIRLPRVPRMWIPFALLAAAIGAAGYFAPVYVEQWGWQTYFGLMIIEIIRVERRCETVHREGVWLVLTALSIDLVIITLQILINYNLFPQIGPDVGIYVFGILAFAIGMSLFLAYDFARTSEREVRSIAMQAELEAARRLQLDMLPRTLPQLPRFDIAVATRTASEVGGDYYDFRTDDGTLVVALGDATGHGVAAGAMVSAIKALFTALGHERDLRAVLTDSDRVLRRMAVPLQMCLSIARVSAEGVAYAAAAMPPMLVWRAATSSVEEIGTQALPLGGRMSPSYEERCTPLAGGDTLLFATDGLAEMLNPGGAPLGFDGAADAFRAAAGGSAQSVVDHLLAKTATWRAGREQLDDMTLVVVRVASSD